MRNLIGLSVCLLLMWSCGYEPRPFDANLSERLDSLASVDQAVQTALFTTSSKAEYDSLHLLKEKTFVRHCAWLKQYLNTEGYPGFDRVGEESSSNFWLMVQHCDEDLDFQKQVLRALKMEVDRENASGSNYAYLYDRVQINQGLEQSYGTQLDYSWDGQAFARPVRDSLAVNERRLALGLEPLEDYLAWVTEAHRARNKDYYEALRDSLGL
ncbi:MAG: DUF6624 domain-containing protein [Bacteroidota bacterium]